MCGRIRSIRKRANDKVTSQSSKEKIDQFSSVFVSFVFAFTSKERRCGGCDVGCLSGINLRKQKALGSPLKSKIEITLFVFNSKNTRRAEKKGTPGERLKSSLKVLGGPKGMW